MATKCLALAQSEITCSTLCVWSSVLGLKADEIKQIVFCPTDQMAEAGVLAYEQLVRRIETEASMADGSLALNEVVILVDVVTPLGLNAASEVLTWDHLLALLILTFPEVRWVFGVIQGKSDWQGREPNWFEQNHGLASHVPLARRDPLFDATGLREWVKDVTTKELAGIGLESGLCRRAKRACAIDEEKSYAYFHAYTAYRYGFRSDVVTSWALMSQLFGKNAPVPHGYELLLEDMSVNFPDRPAKAALLQLDRPGRAEQLPRLDSRDAQQDDSCFRILITSGQGREHQKVLEENRFYLKQKQTQFGKIILKPVGGMLDLWEESGLTKSLRFQGQRSGNAEGFSWPFIVHTSNQSVPTGHGAPGKLFLVAENLVRRAEIFSGAACTVKDYIKGAVLACDAAELLAGKTPTLCLAAIALKHEYETKAESSFVGVGYNFNIAGRLREVHQEVHEVCKWYAPRVRIRAGLDTEVVILNRIATVFGDAGQFEEEQAALVAVRRARSQLQRQDAQNPISWGIGLVQAYAEWLIASFARFAVVVLGWTCAVWGAVHTISPDGTEMHKSGATAVGAFFGGSPTTDADLWIAVITSVAVISGMFHLGVFISYIYTLISRK